MRHKLKHKINTDVFLESYRRHPHNPLLILVGFYKGFYHNFLLSVFFYAIKHSPTWVLPIVTANIINYVTGGVPNMMQLILLNAGILSVLLVLNIPTNAAHMHFRAVAVRNVEAGLRSTLVHKIQTMSIPSEKEIQSGRLQSKIIRDVEAIETLSDQLFVSLLNILLNVTVALSVTIFKSRIVFVFFLLMVPLAASLIYGFKSRIKKHNARFRKEVETASARVAEMVELVPVTRAHALEEEEISKMRKQLQTIAQEGYELDMVQTNFGAVSWVCFQLFQVLCLVFTAYMAVKGRIQTGDVVLYQSYFTTIVGQVSSLMTLLPTISKGLESVNSVAEVLLVEDVEDNEGKEELRDLNGSYQFDHVSYTYPKTDRPVIRDLNLDIRPGETVAFVGESGAGKTTIMSLLLGFCLPTEGKLYIDGKDITKINLHSYRSFLAVVPQASILFSGTIRDNILYGTTDVTEEELQKVVDEAGLRSVIERLPDGLETKVGEHGDKLSGGQKQRISIARALIRDPSVILLDEATSALDAISEREVTSALDHMSHERTTFIVAHKLATIERADRIIVMQDGQILESGTYQELLDRQGHFYELAKQL